MDLESQGTRQSRRRIPMFANKELEAILPPEMVFLYALPKLAALATVGLFTVFGMKVWYKHRDKRHQQIGREEFDQMSDAIEALHEQTLLLREDFQDLHERLDFAERVLAQKRQTEYLDQPEATPV